MRSALRLRERQENQLSALREAIDASAHSGESVESRNDMAARVKQKHDV
ncbi:type II toxin-antitoxin system ParD family antitoxin [Salinisphaera sp. LB1]|nr:type II toxin-antitoxin system ParD family antitoxin [Salinisphaera sp. LB1]